MTLYDYVRVLRDRWLVVVVSTLVCLFVAGSVLVLSPPRYSGTTRVLFGLGGETEAGQLTRTYAYTTSVVQTYAALAELPVVLSPVAARLGLATDADSLAQKVQATSRKDSLILQITASDTDPELAAQLANAVAEQLVVVVSQTSGSAGTATGQVGASSPVFTAQIISTAAVPRAPVFPRPGPVLGIGSATGLFFGFVLAVVIGVRNRRVIDRHSAAAATGLHVVGSIPSGPGRSRSAKSRRERVARGKAHEAAATLFALMMRSRIRTVAFTSAYTDETCAAAVLRIGDALARLGQRTLMVDADLRSPRLALALAQDGAVPNGPGLADVLAGRTGWQQAVVPVRPSGLSLLPTGAGEAGTDPFGSAAFPGLLAELAAAYDLVLVKAPPALRAADGLLVSALVDRVVLVADEAAMSQRSLLELEGSLDLVGARPAGLILNG